jgi:hypothetical protein
VRWRFYTRAVPAFLLSYIKRAAPGGRFALVHVLADAVNDLVELARNDGVSATLPARAGVAALKRLPRRAVAPVEGRIFSLVEGCRDALEADAVLSVQPPSEAVGNLLYRPGFVERGQASAGNGRCRFRLRTGSVAELVCQARPCVK